LSIETVHFADKTTTLTIMTQWLILTVRTNDVLFVLTSNMIHLITEIVKVVYPRNKCRWMIDQIYFLDNINLKERQLCTLEINVGG
jgi:hypothetical protein